MDNRMLIVLCTVFIALLVVLAVVAVKFFGEQKVKNWLVWAVGEAEKAFGGGTGKLKLRSVYNEFVKMFPKLSLIITFSRFSFLVDEALEILAEMLKNDRIANIITQNKEE